MESDSSSLRILLIVNLPWDPRLGAVRVYMELADQWRASGIEITKYCLSDAFSDVPSSSAKLAFQQTLFPYLAAGFVKKNRARFDVIDALIGVLPFPKQRLGFRGLLVARSVGLYRLYERFNQSVTRRWPDLPRGKFLGRVFYSLMRRRFRHASDNAVRYADLINLPNQEEAVCLREEVCTTCPILVRPYGLTEDRRQTLRQAAAPAEFRWAQKRICFIGMWSPRKGGRDWPAITRQIRARVPEAQFRFLGTMVDSKTILTDLGLETADGIEFVSDYQPADLPGLLSDCTVGAFPSYAEGFGLAVLEQLAAGLPTVAYDTAGPHDVLAPHLPDLLVPKGDFDALVDTICRILQGAPDSYEKLAARSHEASTEFSWADIADTTIHTYRDLLRKTSAGPVYFVQPFSLGSAGGGPRILRALLERAPFAWQSVCTAPRKPKTWPNEIHLRSRPGWGRIEHSRFAQVPNRTAPFFAPMFRQRLRKRCIQAGARALHAIPHSGLDFAEVHAVARELSVPFFISLHDDLTYTASGVGVSETMREDAMGVAWQEAAGRFVISEALGEEYCQRYGKRDYNVVTDGLSELTPLRAETNPRSLHVYFMGLFHMGYERNLCALLEGLARLEKANPSMTVRITCRCEHIRAEVLEGLKEVTVLPFADEAQVKLDMETADLLYLPMPFGEVYEKFARYSLSTKMVTYAGSGVPMLYHGPVTSAAFDLLKKNDAAIFVTSLAPEEIAQTLSGLTQQRRGEIAANALALARREFMLEDQTRKFWDAFTRVLSPA